MGLIMTYSESAKGQWINKGRVYKEMQDHGIVASEMMDFWNNHAPNQAGLYSASSLMEWLGY